MSHQCARAIAGPLAALWSLAGGGRCSWPTWLLTAGVTSTDFSERGEEGIAVVSKWDSGIGKGGIVGIFWIPPNLSPHSTHKNKVCCSQAGSFAGHTPAPVVKTALYPFRAFSAVPGTAVSGEKLHIISVPKRR